MKFTLSDVTAVVICHDAGPLLKRALDSISAEGPVRIVLVDDGSTSCACREISSDYQHLRRVGRANGGQAAALNSGIVEVRTELIAFLDHDDEWLPGKTQRQIELLARNDAEVVVGGVRNVAEQDGVVISDDLFPATRVLGAITALTRSVRRVGPFDNSTRHHCIVDWWSRADHAGLIRVNDDEPVLLRRIHGGNSGVIHRAAARRDLLHHLRGRVANRTRA